MRRLRKRTGEWGWRTHAEGKIFVVIVGEDAHPFHGGAAGGGGGGAARA
jgi:hypothetical protein